MPTVPAIASPKPPIAPNPMRSVSRKPVVQREAPGHPSKNQIKKATKFPKRGPLPERASCQVNGHPGHVENSYTATKKWVASYCVFVTGSVPQEKTFQKDAPESVLNKMTLPHGWLSLHNAHTGESLCINIFTDQDCPKTWDVPTLLASSAPPPWPAQTGVHDVQEHLPEGPPSLAPSSEEPPEAPVADALDSPTPEEPIKAAEPLAPKIPVLQNTPEEPVQEAEEEPTTEDRGEDPPQADLLQKAFGGFATDHVIETDLPPIHPEAQRKIDSVCRHYKNPDHQQSIYPRTLIVLSLVFERFQKPIELYSGHRFQPRTTSRHFGGRAADITLPGVPIEKVKAFLLRIGNRALGIGLYAVQNFLHVDSRDRPFYCFAEKRHLLRSAKPPVHKRPANPHKPKRV